MTTDATNPNLTAARAFHEDATHDRQRAGEAWDESLRDLRAAQRLLETCKARHAATGAALDTARTVEARAEALLVTAERDEDQRVATATGLTALGPLTIGARVRVNNGGPTGFLGDEATVARLTVEGTTLGYVGVRFDHSPASLVDLHMSVLDVL